MPSVVRALPNEREVMRLAFDVLTLELDDSVSEVDVLADSLDDGADSTIAENAEAFRFKLLLRESQQVVLPLGEQQKPPSGMTEPWHSTTKLSSPE